MDLFDLIEFEMDEDEYNYLERIPRLREIRNRNNYMETLDDVDFRSRFRLTKTAVNFIHGLIHDKISRRTMRNHAVPSLHQLILSLRYFATGCYLTSAGDFSGVSKSSACRIIRNVSEALANLRPMYIKFPQNTEELKEDFYTIAKFPRVIGAIDCTHVVIKSPGGDTAEIFRNRKSQFSINVQTICSAKLKVMDVVARWPGSCHDQTIFNNSRIKQRIEEGEFGNSFILGDSGYENKSYILTPLSNPSTSAENLYNESHIRTRNVVERMYGVLKNRFPVLRRTVTLSVDRVQAIIVACIVLHNMAIDMNEELFLALSDQNEFQEEENVPLPYAGENSTEENATRQLLINDYFQGLIENE